MRAILAVLLIATLLVVVLLLGRIKPTVGLTPEEGDEQQAERPIESLKGADDLLPTMPTLLPGAPRLAGTVVGRVVDHRTEAPIAGAHVTAQWHRSQDDAEDLFKVTTTDTRGEFRLGRSDPVVPTILVLHPSYAPFAQSIVLGDVGPVIRLRPGTSARGRVLDQEGRPVLGAHVLFTLRPDELWDEHRRAGPARPDSAARSAGLVIPCDDDGRFALDLVDLHEPSSHLVAEADGYFGRAVALEDVADLESELQLVLVKGARASGVVLGPDGRPAPGIPVAFRHSSDEVWTNYDAPSGPVVTTTPEGTFEFEAVPAGCSALTARTGRDEELGVALIEPLLAGEHRQDIQLQIQYHQVTRVRLSGPDGLPASDEHVIVRRAPTASANRLGGWTDADGEIEFELGDPGPWTFLRRRPDGEDLIASEVHLPSPVIAATVDPSLRTRLTIRAQRPDGTPLDRYEIALEGDDTFPVGYSKAWPGIWSACSGPLGVSVPRGLHLRGRIETEEEAIAFHVVTRLAEQDVLVTLEPSARITGVVTDAAGRPVVGAEVRARLKYSYLIIPPPLVGRTDEEGKFDLGDDPQEWSTLYIDVLPPPGYRSVRGARRGPYELPLSFVLPPGVDVTGRLVAAEGVPLGGLELLAESMLDGAEPSRVHVTTQDDGTFRIAGVPEAWTATLQLDLDELAKRGLRPESALEPVRAGQSGVEIRLAAGGSIRGRVRGELPTDEALVVRAWPHDVTARGSRAADVDAGGAFELNALPPGPHALELWLNGENESLLLGVVDAEMGGEDVVFEMPKLGMVRVELPADAEDWWADGVSTTSHHRALEVWGLTGPVAAIRVVQDASYSLKVYSGSWPGNTLAIARVSDGESFRQPFRSELDLRVRFVGGRLPANATLLARHVETGLESVFDGRPWSTAEVPDGAYDVVLVGSARSETVVARGLRPTGAWHEVRLP